MPKTELNILFKKMQRDDKKDVLKFEYKSKDKDEKIKIPQSIYDMVGEMVNIEIEGSKCGPVTAELAKANKDGKKVVLDLSLKGDSADKAVDIFLKAGTNVKLFIEPSQASLIEEEHEDPHEGIEYAVALDGTVDVNKKEELQEVAATVEEVDPDALDDEHPFQKEIPGFCRGFLYQTGIEVNRIAF